jgi:pimeloyl-ACP methyl ester carboxylesterase
LNRKNLFKMEHYINYCGANIRYKVSGKGNTTVLLHGFTESLAIWENFSEVLSLENKIICIDLPGHGKSGCIGKVHSMEAMASCVKAVLDTEKVKECIMIGHSMGGYVALAFAELFPKMIRGLGLFHSSALPDTPEGKLNRTRSIEVIKANHGEFISSFIPDLFAPENRTSLEKEIAILVECARKMTKESIIACQSGMMERSDKRHILEQLPVPFLFIAGKKDTRVPYAKVLEQMALPNDSVALLLGNIAHMGYLEAPKKTLYALNCFIYGVFK